jgi:glycosyltransferase involved in cell wall biosynthesis
MDSEAILVSILVPIYGVEKYIERCARSLFEQSYSNLEFVFVNDATPDKSVEILQQVIPQYPKWEGRITIISHDKNRGLAAARNTLVDNCRGEFLLHVDSDDWIEPNTVELFVKKQNETNADIVTGSYISHIIKEGSEKTRRWIAPDNDRLETLKGMLKFGSVVATWNRLIRSSLYRDNNIRWVEGIDAGEDKIITPRLIYCSRKVAACDSFTYHYNCSNTNSIVNMLPNSLNIQLQLIRACQVNVDFFRDKETYLYEAANQELVERMKKMLEINFKNMSSYGYNTMLAMLDETDQKYWPLIGWDRPRKRWLDHHYNLRKSYLLQVLRNAKCKFNTIIRKR